MVAFAGAPALAGQAPVPAPVIYDFTVPVHGFDSRRYIYGDLQEEYVSGAVTGQISIDTTRLGPQLADGSNPSIQSLYERFGNDPFATITLNLTGSGTHDGALVATPATPNGWIGGGPTQELYISSDGAGGHGAHISSRSSLIQPGGIFPATEVNTLFSIDISTGVDMSSVNGTTLPRFLDGALFNFAYAIAGTGRIAPFSANIIGVQSLFSLTGGGMFGQAAPEGNANGQPAGVPEPGMACLLGFGALALGVRGVRRRGGLLLPGAPRTAGVRFCCPVRPGPR